MRALFILIFIYLLALACSAQVIPGIIAASTNHRGGTPPVKEGFTHSQEFTIVTPDKLQRVELTHHSAMQDHYEDIRFVVDPSGTITERLYLDYGFEYGVSDTVAWVSVPTGETSFYMVWGDANAPPVDDPYKAFSSAGYYYNDWSRGVNYDIVNVLGGYDKLLAGDANGEETWPAGWQDPRPDSAVHCGVIFKRQSTNLHAGNPKAHTGMIVTHDGWVTWDPETNIDDPGAEYDATSSTSVAIPTSDPTTVVFTVPAGLPWLPGDLGQARASDTQYFDFSVTTYSGTTLTVSSSAHLGAGTFASWDITTRIGATNATITAVRMPNDTIRLVMINSHVDYSITASTIRVGTKYSDDWGVTWSEWTQRGPSQWINVGGQAITMDNGYCVLSAHQNPGFEGMTEQTLWFFITRDYGVTWETHSMSYAGLYLDEAGMFQRKDPTTWEWMEDWVRVITRVESSPFHYHTFDLYIGETDVYNTYPVENPFYVDEQSRGTYTWCGNTLIGAFGDVREQTVLSYDGGDTWFGTPYTTVEGSIYSSRRVYTIFYYLGNGKTVKIWSNNKLSGGADLYINYTDSYLMALHAVSSNTLTDSRTRPDDLDPGLRINGSLITGYRTTSTTSVAIPTSHPTSVTLTVGTGLSWVNGETGVCTRNISGGGNRFTFTVVAYNSGTGQLDVNSSANTGTGTFADWTLDKTSNLLSDQAFVSTWNRNGSLSPYRLQITAKSPSLGGGFFGLKKDETRATGVVTITNAGNEGDEIIIKWSTTSSYGGLFTGLSTVARYTVQHGDGTQEVIDGLAASAELIGVSRVSASTSNTITLEATRGESTFANGRAWTVVNNGQIHGSAANFSGGAAFESVVGLSNIIELDVSNNLVRIEQANDNHNQAFTAAKNVNVNYTITWTPTLVTVTDGTTTRTKGPATGSGVPNWDGQILLYVSTTAASPQGFHENYKIVTKPETDTDVTPGSIVEGEFTERDDGQGLSGGSRAYVAFPEAPTLSDTHTLVQATTGTGIQSGDLGGKLNFKVSGNYSFMQFNVVNDDSYALTSLDQTSPSTWSKIGSPSPQDYAVDEVNAAHGYSFYNLWFRDADNLIKKRPFDTTGTLSPIVFENCIFTDAGFGGVLINQSIAGRGYGKFTESFCSFTGGGAERNYLGSTGSATTKYMDTTRISHIYSNDSRREVVQLNNHKYVVVSNVTGLNVGVVQEEPPQGIGQENFIQCQGCGAGYLKNSIGGSTAPMMIASTGIDLINNRITWTQTDRALYLQDVVGNGYAYKNMGDDTVRIEGNDFICEGFTLDHVFRIQEDDFVVVIRYNNFPPSATDIYQCDGPCPTIILEGNTFDSDKVPPVTFEDHPDPAYAPYWKVVTSPYDYLKGRGALTPHRP